MFDLVNDIESYPKFLHWCRGARVDVELANTVEATLEIGVLGFQQRFRTRNTLQRPGADRHRSRLGAFSAVARRMAIRPSGRARSGDLVDADVRGHAVAIRSRVRQSVRGARGVADGGVHCARQGDLRRRHLTGRSPSSSGVTFVQAGGCSAKSRSMRVTRSFSKWTTTQRWIRSGERPRRK